MILQIVQTAFAVIALNNIGSTEGLSLLSNATLRETCNPSLDHLGDPNEGIAVCVAGDTGNIITNAFSDIGNFIYVIQNALDLGNCVCNQECNPSQIVCENPRHTKFILRLLGILSGNLNVIGSITQFIYALEHYTAFCYCPKLIPAGQDPCRILGAPEPCPFPEDRKRQLPLVA